MKKLYPIFIAFLFTTILHAQLNVLVNPPSYIKTVTFYNQYVNDFSPIIKLGDRFTISFDDLSAEQEDYTYQIRHYDFNWEPSGLATTEYIEGYDADRIRNFESSFNTFQPYTHYNFSIPNEHTTIKLSGNYIISVLDEADEVIFNRSFIVYESLVTVGVSAHKSKTIADINSKQRLEVLVDYPNYRINNPNSEIKLLAIQNYDWNQQLKNALPTFHRGTQLIYNQNELSFWAGNEYHYFDNKEIRNPVNKVAKVELQDVFNTYLYSDEPRARLPYTFNPDINGNFSVRTIDSDNNNVEADYAKVYFSFLAAHQQDHEVYLYGNFNNWQLTDENKMTYHASENRYTAQLLLKQGFYNYTYMAVDKSKKIESTKLEGSFYQTENSYGVFIYHRPFGTRYDRIIGFGQVDVTTLRN